jgi:sugar phosphate isomerase/epimerase
MIHQTRREFLRQSAVLGGATLSLAAGAASTVRAATSARRFTLDLRCGSIGVRANQREAIQLAAEQGFESVTPDPGFLAELSDGQRNELVALLKDRKLVWGSAGLPVDFRRDDATFQQGLKQLPGRADALKAVGVTRVGTWLRPNHDELTYVANFRQHVARLRQCAKILGDHGQRFGLEYVGPKTLWSGSRHSFIHTMAETKDLIADIGLTNVGFVLDSWHWYTAHETDADLLTLTNDQIVACDLNDAPAGIEVDQQMDNRRELPAATGVIDLRAFLQTLIELKYDGPVRAEPFNQPLNEMNDEAAVAATSRAMRKAFALVDG